MKKKKIAIIIAGALLFEAGTILYDGINKSNSALAVENQNTESCDIDLSTIRLNKKEFKPGETVKISFKTKNKLYNQKYKYSIGYDEGSSGYSMIDFKYDSVDKAYVAEYEIKEYAHNGLWNVASMRKSLINQSGPATSGTEGFNYWEGTDEPSIKELFAKLKFSVNGAKVDKQPPTIDRDSIKFNKKDYKLGDEIKVSLKAQDDVSGISLASISGERYYIDLKYNEKTKLYEGSYKIKENDKNGSITFNSVNVHDVAGNMSSYGIDKKINVSGASDDIEAPKVDLNSINISKNILKENEEAKISMKITDNYKGYVFAAINYRNKNTQAYKRIELAYNKDNKLYEGVINISKYEDKGDWIADSIDVRDQADNNDSISMHNKDISILDFNIEGRREEWSPELKIDSKDISVNKKEIKAGENIKFSIKANKDLKGLDSDRGITVEYISKENREKKKYINLRYDDKTDSYIGETEIDKYNSNGEWVLSKISLYKDNQYKEMINSGELDKFNFYVINSKTDNKQVKLDLSTLKINKNEFKPNDTIEISIKAIDDISGVSSVGIEFDKEFEEGKYGPSGIKFDYDKDTDSYIWRKEVNQYDNFGEWTVKNIYTNDNAGNYETVEIQKGPSFKIIGTTPDRNGPIIDLNSLKINKSKLTGDECVKLSLKATDDVSGIGGISVGYKNGKSKLDFEFNDKTGDYECIIPISKYEKSEKKKIDYIECYDKNWNSTDYNSSKYDLSKFDYEVYGTTYDSKPPTLTKECITTSNSNPKAGDTVIITIEAKDDISGVEEVYINYKDFGYGLDRINGTNKFERKIKIPKYGIKDQLEIKSISLRDKAGNYTEITDKEIIKKLDFSLSGIKEDVKGPNIDIDSIKFSKADVKPGDKVKISVKITDDVSGVSSVDLDLCNENMTNGNYYVYLEYNPKSKCYEGEFDIHNDTNNGKWYISSLSAIDDAENITEIDKAKLKNKTFNVTGGKDDFLAPSIYLDTIKFNKDNYNPGDIFKFSLKVTDDKSGIERGNITIGDKGDNNSIYIECKYNPKTNLFEGEYTVGKYIANGNWTIKKIEFSDKKGNTNCLENEDFNKYKFKITGARTDLEAPKFDLDSLKINTNEPKIGDKIKISIGCKDNISGINDVNAFLICDDEHMKNIVMKYNQSTKLYEGETIINKYFKSGKWILENLNATDVAGNSDSIDINNKKIGFEVKGTELDKEVPYIDINSLNISKKEVMRGEKVKVSIRAKDDKSGINEAYIVYDRGKGLSESTPEYRLNYNKNTGLYEAFIEIPKDAISETWIPLSIMFIDNENNANSVNLEKNKNELKKIEFKVVDDITNIKKEGWILEGENWKYYNSEGLEYKGWLSKDKWYYLNEDGIMQTGWKLINGKWYKFDNSGVMKDKWYKEGNAWYYLEGGAMQTGWRVINEKWYKFDNSGVMKDNWYKEGNTWYYLEDGAMQTGWKLINNNWYLFNESGKMLTNKIVDGWKIDKNGIAKK